MEQEFIKFRIDDGILFSEYTKITIGSLEVIKEVIRLRTEFSENKKQYWCYNINNLKSMNIESRNYAEKHGQDLLYACAVLVNSHVTKFIFNAFLKLKSPNIPFKSFTSNEDAITWLKKLKSENEQAN